MQSEQLIQDFIFRIKFWSDLGRWRSFYEEGKYNTFLPFISGFLMYFLIFVTPFLYFKSSIRKGFNNPRALLWLGNRMLICLCLFLFMFFLFVCFWLNLGGKALLWWGNRMLICDLPTKLAATNDGFLFGKDIFVFWTIFLSKIWMGF